MGYLNRKPAFNPTQTERNQAKRRRQRERATPTEPPTSHRYDRIEQRVLNRAGLRRRQPHPYGQRITR